MIKQSLLFFPFTIFCLAPAVAQPAATRAERATAIRIANGLLQGSTDPQTGDRIFRGIPYAQPPVGPLRWREPQPVHNWEGVRSADKFGPKAMQKFIFTDMRFRTDTMSEDCLYLNVWTPAKTAGAHLPVLVYFFGGGFIAGDGSEWRYDGASLASKGIVVVTVNYRLGIFGFFSHPELTKESPHHASGNYGLLDQQAALEWVHRNIAAFGGDPRKVTIGGESAGSISVFAQMASPLSKNLIAGAIGESGAMINPTLPPVSLEEAEKNGLAFAKMAGATSLADLRAIPAGKLLDDAFLPGAPHFGAVVDGYFFPQSPLAIFEKGEQAHVPLLVGWNSTEVPYMALMSGAAPTPENYAKRIGELYGGQAGEVMKLYPGNNEGEVIRSATALASDRFIAFSTWKWADLQRNTGELPVYRYLFGQPRPEPEEKSAQPAKGSMPPAEKGAGHSWEIEYALGNLATNKSYAWTPDDYKVSHTMENYFANFIKTGNPNGPGLPAWTGNTVNKPVWVMHIGVNSREEREQHRGRYEFLDKLYVK